MSKNDYTTMLYTIRYDMHLLKIESCFSPIILVFMNYEIS